MTLTPHFVFVGFANSGKSTLFNLITAGKQKTGNWSGVTVAAKQQKAEFNQQLSLFTDLPGIPSLSQRDQQSGDLTVTHQFLKTQSISCLINVVDATQLQRQLYLTTQLLELGFPMLVVLSKADRKEAAQVDIDILQQQLGCPVIAIDNRRQGSADILSEQLQQLPAATVRPTNLVVPSQVNANCKEEAENEIEHTQADALLATELASTQSSCECENGNPLTIAIMQARYAFIKSTLALAITAKAGKRSLSDRLDDYILFPAFGVPIFFMMMYLLFMFAINVGSAFIDFFDILGGALLVDYPQHYLSELGLPVWLMTLFEGIGTGIQTVATFIPVIVCLFIGLSLLETSGYLARAAFVVESVMQKIGLPGKAFVPLIVGFGCTVPAVMSARVLDSERERITTVMMSPFMSCGARLPVYALFAAAFFPESGQNIVFLLYLLGIVAALFTGFLLKKTVLPGNSSMNIMELPLYELPKLGHLISRVTSRTRSFIFGAGKTIVIVVCVLNFLNSFGTDGEFGHHDSNTSVLSKGAQVITPILAPMGIEEDNWQAGVGIITGIFAKEALVGTFNSLYSSSQQVAGGERPFSEVWDEAVESIGLNLGAIAPEDPIGITVGDIDDLYIASQEQDVEISTYYAMQSAFTGQLGAFSYLLFILLYTPCAAAMGAIKNEVGSRWATFAALWSLSLAYLSATLCYQIGSFSQHPAQSLMLIAFVLSCFLAIFAWLKYKGRKILTIPISVTYS